ncbi:MAG: TRAP transporter substrate-binding protein [Desulfatitalea sp.]|nr:TRAP transporter substrate-binding protein [Desulfatitalea sp.]
MKKSAMGFMLIWALLSLGLVMAGTGVNPAAAGTVTLTYSNFFPPTHVQSQLAESWCQEIEKRTEGRVKVQYFAGQTLTKANQTYDSVVNGIADIGMSAFAYTRGRFPVMGAVDMPMGYPSGVTATTVANMIFEGYAAKELSDTQVMFLHAHGPGMLHTRKKAVATLDDLKGLKIRSTGISAELITALGGSPVPMPMPESYQSLQKGVVDGSVHPLETNKGWKLAEVVDYVTMANSVAYTTTFFVAMNKAKWNALDAKDQAAISALNREFSVKHGQAWDSSDAEGLKVFKENGKTVVELDPQEMARWSAAAAPMIQAYAQKLDQDGLKGTAVVEAIRQELSKKAAK